MSTTFDFIVIGAGPGGEAAAHKARELGATVAVIDRRWFGGSCPFIGCLPSKALLHGAAEHHANPAAYPWPRASAHRDYMVNRDPDAAAPSDAGHVGSLERAGATVFPGEARITGRGEVHVRHDETHHDLSATNVIVAVGSNSRPLRIPGVEDIEVWTNEQATLARELPRSLLILGGGPTGCELAQVYARFGVPTTIVQSGPRLSPTDHPRNSDVVRAALEADGVIVRTDARAVRARAGAGADGAHVVELDDGPPVEGHVLMAAIGREVPLEELGLEHYGLDASRRTPPYPRDGRLRIADGLYAIGDSAGPELHTHQAHYQGEIAVRMALGEDVTPDYRALPRATYMDPEAAFVGMTVEQGTGRRHRCLRAHRRLRHQHEGLRHRGEARPHHDRRRPASRELVGAATACPDASTAIDECVIAIQAHVPMDVLAAAIHAFPSTSRIFNGLFADALRELDHPGSVLGG